MDQAQNNLCGNKGKERVAKDLFYQMKTNAQKIEQWKLSKLQPIGALSLVYLLKIYSHKDLLFGRSLDLIETVYNKMFATESGKLFAKFLKNSPKSKKLDKEELLSHNLENKTQLESLISNDSLDYLELIKELKQHLYSRYQKLNTKAENSLDESFGQLSGVQSPSLHSRILQASKQPLKPEESSLFTIVAKNELDSKNLNSEKASLVSLENYQDERNIDRLSFTGLQKAISQQLKRNRLKQYNTFDY